MLRVSVDRALSRLCLLVAILCAACAPAGAQTQQPGLCCSGGFHLGPSGAQVAGALIGAGAVVGVGTYFLVRASRETGCVAGNGGALLLQQGSAGDHAYLLEGATTGLQPGERVKVIGRKHHDANHRPVLKVSRVARDYGRCSMALASNSGVAAP